MRCPPLFSVSVHHKMLNEVLNAQNKTISRNQTQENQPNKIVSLSAFIHQWSDPQLAPVVQGTVGLLVG